MDTNSIFTYIDIRIFYTEKKGVRMRKYAFSSNVAVSYAISIKKFRLK